MTRFDLTKVGQGYGAQVARLRWFVAAFLVVALVATAYLAVRYELAASWTLVEVETVAGLGLIAGAVGFVTWTLSPGALSVEVDEAKVRFEYPGGRLKSLAWEDRHFRLVVDHTTGASDSISLGKPVQLAADRRVFQDFLSPAAFQAILREADRHGLNVTERSSPRWGWRRSTISRSPG